MKILVVGTGVIGTLYGQVLSQRNEVVHFVRPEKFEDKNDRVIRWDYIDERRTKKEQNTTGTYQYRCVTKADDSYDLIFVPVKTFQLLELLKTLVKQAPGAKYLIFTLDWNLMDGVDKILEKNQYMVGYAGGGGTFQGDLLWGNLGKDVMLGTVYSEQQELLKRVDGCFRECGIVPEIPGQARHWLWMHNVSTAPFGIALAKDRNLAKCLEDRALIKTVFGACRECCAICQARGVDLKQFPEAIMYHIPFFLLYPMFKRNLTKNPVVQRYTSHAVSDIDEMSANFEEMYQSGLELKIEMSDMHILHNIIHPENAEENLTAY